MPKTTTKFVCQNCGTVYPRWMGKCENCGAWNSLLEEAAPAPVAGAAGTKAQAAAPLQPTALSQVNTAHLPRMPSGFDEVDRVLGGGIVPGAVMLLSGDPGIGKSTLVLQLAANLSGKP
jgi:DNA repair protein RadA/Sms